MSCRLVCLDSLPISLHAARPLVRWRAKLISPRNPETSSEYTRRGAFYLLLYIRIYYDIYIYEYKYKGNQPETNPDPVRRRPCRVYVDAIFSQLRMRWSMLVSTRLLPCTFRCSFETLLKLRILLLLVRILRSRLSGSGIHAVYGFRCHPKWLPSRP